MRYRVTFSVLGLFVLVLVMAVIIGYVVNAGRLHKAEQELQTLRQETGHLTIEDRTKFHAVTVPVEEPNTWRWRVFLPKGRRYSWQIATKDIPQNSVPKGTHHGSYSQGHDWENESEVLVTARLRKTDEGDWRLAITPRMGDDRNTFYGAALTIPKEELAWMFTGCTDGQVLAHNGMVVRDPEGPFIFLQQRACEKQSDGTDRSSPNPMPGFMIWLQKW